MTDNTPLAREIVAALVYLNSHKEAVPSHGHGLFSEIRARYESKAGNVNGGSLDEAAVEVVKEKLDAAYSAPAPDPEPAPVLDTPVAPVEPSTPPLGDLPSEPEHKEGE